LAGILATAITANLGAQTAGDPDPGRLTQATRALLDNRPFRATQLLSPVLATPAGRAPETILLAARAAAGWEGWTTVVRLLSPEPWLDRIEGGEGRALLARARVERGDDAIQDARAAVQTASPAALGSRLVTLARAFDRADLLDSAASAYRRAATELPSVGDWLRLRVAGVVADSTERARLFQNVVLPAAAGRIHWTDALARDRTGDPLGAARVYQSLGAMLAGIRLRLKATPDSSPRARIRQELVGLLTPKLSGDDARDAIVLLDATFAPLSAAEELVVARRAAVVDRLPRAAAAFARAGRLGESDRLVYGSVLARLGRHHEAMEVLDKIGGPTLLPQAQYLRARSLLRVGSPAAAISALRQVVKSFSYDTATAATAGFLVADLLVDSGNETAARTAYLEVSRRFPSTSHGSRAALQAALVLLNHGGARAAATEFLSLADRPGDRSETAAGMYWAGRALAASGDSSGARDRWRSVLNTFPSSYYAVPASQRLGVTAISITPGVPAGPIDSMAAAALDRGALLERLGLRVEARFEYDRLSRVAEGSATSLGPIATAFATRGYTARAYRLAQRAGDGSLQRLSFPIPRASVLFEEASQATVDPLLAASLIRQESGFDPTARSRADARGLMQVLPNVGASLARASGLREWDPTLLDQPELNVHFGLIHLAEALRRYPRIESALAAYNAGTRAADQWLALPGALADPEMFVERIQYVETRDYVRRILRNLAVYRALYPAPT
jgi:soluble lytic murein transglycosylase